ncbi:MAG: CHAD domain-containing protein [Thermoplasmata archaeon]|nr:CHAD domain-containing protein [Thermoplasmata archaeon]
MTKPLTSSFSPTTLARYVRECLTTAIAATDRVIQRPHPTAEDLHDLHRNLRRLRTLTGVAARVGRRAGRRAWPALDGRLRRATQLVGEVRDLDVALTLVDRFLGGSPPSESNEDSALWTLRRRLRDDTRTGRELLRATLRAERQGGLFEEVAVALGGSITAPTTEAIARGLEEERRLLERSARRARKRSMRRPSPERLHEVRVRVRRWRYLSDLQDALQGTPSSTFPRRLASIQRRLGELHDRDVLAQQLDALDPNHRREPWARAFHEEHRRMRHELIRELKGLHLRHHRTVRGVSDRPAPTGSQPRARHRPATRRTNARHR